MAFRIQGVLDFSLVGILSAVSYTHLKKVNEFKEADGWLYAIYGTPAESLCGLQVEQFRKMYGIVENVSDRPYVSNSFHCCLLYTSGGKGRLYHQCLPVRP